jgi:hypothetical protein
MRMTWRFAGLAVMASCAVLGAAPRNAHAQASLSMLGFGYPVGGQSARSLASGTSLADLDPQTPLNPASIVLNSRAQAYGQYEPEFRTVTIGGVSAKTTTSRFPLFMVTGRQGRATFSLSFSSLFDRTWVNTYADTQRVGTERIASTVLTQSIGGISDGRVAMAWSFNERVHVGIAAHVYPGQNRVSVGRIFADSAHAGNFDATNAYDFAGSGLSFGALYLPGSHFILSGDLRVGGSLSMRLGDSTVVGKGKVPLRYGASAAYDGIPGSIFSVRIGGERWSDLRGLGESTLGLKDATDLALGTEISGPRISGTPVLFRAGYRSRGLPFAFGANGVSESSLSGGVGMPLIGGRAVVDVGVVRASRTSVGVSEKAWVVSVGVGIRP